MMKSETIRLIHLNAAEEISKIGRELSDIEMRRRFLEEKKNKFIQIKSECEEYICKPCNGYGYIQHWYAQDDVKAETCEKCKGSGINA